MKQTEISNDQKLKQTFDPYAPHKIKWWGWPLLLLLIVGTIYVMRNNGAHKTDSEYTVWPADEVQKCEGAIFGTFYHITYQSITPMQDGIEQTLEQVDNSLSPFNKQSVITAINNNICLDADSMFTEVFNLAKQISSNTNGAFDITVAPLVNLWGFGFQHMDSVSDCIVDSLLQFVGFGKVSLVDGIVKKEFPETMLDCSAIAKGYGVDAVGKYLERQGVKNYMVEIGGEVRVRGTNPKGALWKIGINRPISDPTNTKNEIEQVLNVTQLSMATSGNYRNFYEKDGKKYAHTIDPRTGHPVQHSLLSSTVLTQDCSVADAYATAFMVLGMDEAQKVLATHHELQAFFIYTDSLGQTKEWFTEGIKEMMNQ